MLDSLSSSSSSFSDYIDDDDDGAVRLLELHAASEEQQQNASIEQHDQQQQQQHEQQSNTKKSNIVFASFNVLNSIVGAGMLQIPFAMVEAGFFVGLILLVLAGVLTNYSIRLMVKVGSGETNQCLTYPDLVARAFPIGGRVVALGAMWSFAFGAMLVYTIIIGETIPYTLQLLQLNYWFFERETVIVAFALVIFLPLSLMRNVASLSKFSGVAMLCAFTSVGIVLSNVGREKVERPLNFVAPNVFPALGVMAGAYVCNHNTFIIYRSLKRRSYKRWTHVANLSVVVACVMLLTIAVGGYWAFGLEITGNILTNLPNDAAGSTARICSAILLSLTFPIENVVARECITEIIESCKCARRYLHSQPSSSSSSSSSSTQQSTTTTTTTTKQNSSSIQLEENRQASTDDDDEKINTITTQQPAIVQPTNTTTINESREAKLSHIITIVSITVVVVLAIALPDSAIVFELIGSFSATLLCFILPAASALRLSKDATKLQLAPMWFLLIFGIVAMLAGTGNTFYNIVSKPVKHH